MAGIENVIIIYRKNKEIIDENKEVEKHMKLQSKSKLEQEIAKRIEK